MRIDSAAMNDDITTSLRGLNQLAKILKKGRIEKGYVVKILIQALISYSVELTFGFSSVYC
jgi:hypothetical protein